MRILLVFAVSTIVQTAHLDFTALYYYGVEGIWMVSWLCVTMGEGKEGEGEGVQENNGTGLRESTKISVFQIIKTMVQTRNTTVDPPQIVTSKSAS